MMRANKWVIGSAFSIGACALAGLAPGATVSLTATSSGSIHRSSTSYSLNTGTYRTGDDFGANSFRSFFVFDLTGVTGTIQSASLSLNTYGFVSPSGTESFSLYEAAQSSATTGGAAA